MKEIASAFVKAKKEFSPALKTSSNPHFKSKYADLGSCLEAVNEALLNHGIAVFQETFEDDSGVTVETVFLHETGETLRGGKLHVPAAKQDPQGYGSALTYCRRYSLMAACGIAAEDDDGNAASRPRAVQSLSASSVADFIAMINDSGDIESLKKSFATAYRAAEHLGDTKAAVQFEKAKDDRKTALTEQKEPA